MTADRKDSSVSGQKVEYLRDRAKEWSEILPQYSATLESERRLPQTLSKQFAEEGFYRLLVPESLGGFEAHPLQVIEILKILAAGDASAAWNVMIAATTGLLAASLPEPFATQIYQRNPEVMTVGVTAPMGKAERVTGGYLVSGRWPFGSGSQNADWICGGALVYHKDQPLLNSRGQPDVHLMMFEAEQITIEDTWYVSGLKGTGSHHFEVIEQFVPEGRLVVLGSKALID
ncbi:MAG: acyl-CoA dehydrogenase family protein, partial [Gammaproteobacteria bacterium]|nr:acyl-CoA dehydrogenase family protein [Gammaproteobacteria bacterium]